MLLSDAIAAYVAERAQTGEITPVTAEQFGWRLRLLARCHPALHIGDLTRAHVVDWQRTTGAQRPATRRGYLSTLKTFCAWAVDQGIIDRRDPNRPAASGPRRTVQVAAFVGRETGPPRAGPARRAGPADRRPHAPSGVAVRRGRPPGLL